MAQAKKPTTHTATIPLDVLMLPEGEVARAVALDDKGNLVVTLSGGGPDVCAYGQALRHEGTTWVRVIFENQSAEAN